MTKVAIHLCQLSESNNQLQLSSSLLSMEEESRAGRFINAPDADRYSRAHHFLRIQLAGKLGVSPATIEFQNGEYGKPYIPESKIHFNLSYRGDYALLGIADGEVGVDVEQIRNIEDVDAFCSCYFHANERLIIDQASESEQPKTIFTFWAFKEAFIKALGIGFSRDLTQFDLSPFYFSPIHELPFEKGTVFTIERVIVADGYMGAVAYQHYTK